MSTVTHTLTSLNGEPWTTTITYDPFERATITTRRIRSSYKPSGPSLTPMVESTKLKIATPPLKNGEYLTTMVSTDVDTWTHTNDWETSTSTITTTWLYTRTSTVTPVITLFTKEEADSLTTPFIYKPECTALPSLCKEPACTDDRFWRDACTPFPASETILCVDPLSTDWAACQPRMPSMKLKYSSMPTITNYYTSAVCPQEWVALDVGLQSRYLGEGRKSTKDNGEVEYHYTVSTAWCCGNGDSLGNDTFHLYDDIWMPPKDGKYSKICVGSWGGATPSTRTVTADVSTPVPITTGTAFYPPWRIEWVSEDVPSLSPQWPTLTSNMLIPTWTEGMSIKKGEYDNQGTFTEYTYADSGGGGGGVDRDQAAIDGALQGKIMKIVLPVLFVGGLLLVTCWAGCRKARKQRKRDAQERAANGVDGGEMGVVEEVRGEGPLARGKREAKEEAREMVTGVAKVVGGAPV